MKYLLFGGAPSVGKSESIGRLVKKFLIEKKHFTITQTNYSPIIAGNFMAVLQEKNNVEKPIKILINTAADDTKIIEQFKKFHDQNLPADFIISSVRDYGFYPRSGFFSIMEIKDPMNNTNSEADTITEIPLAKITRRKPNQQKALEWYKNRVDSLAAHILSCHPFNL